MAIGKTASDPTVDLLVYLQRGPSSSGRYTPFSPLSYGRGGGSSGKETRWEDTHWV